MTKELNGGYRKLYDQFQQAWDRLKFGWSWVEIQTAVSCLPTVSEENVRNHTIAALEVNLANLSTNNQLAPDIEGAVHLLQFRWRAVGKSGITSVEEKFPDLIAQLETPYSPDFAVPGKYLPTAAIALLGKLSPEHLAKIHDLARTDRQLTTPWLVTLLALRAEKPEIALSVEELISDLPELPDHIRQILLNERPGQLWLAQNGQLRATESTRNLQSAYPLYTSAKQPGAATSSIEPQKTVATKEETKKPTVEETLTLPFLGEIGLVNPQDAYFLIESALAKNPDLETSDLLEECDRLTRRWQHDHRFYNHRTVLYCQQLNSDNQRLQLAKRLAIDAIYINEGTVIFVLEENIGFGASLDQSGLLRINGLPDSFLGEPAQLLLNKLALELAMQRLKNTQEVDEHALNRAIASWNRSVRSFHRDLPQIGPSPNSFLALSVEGSKEPVLVGELPKK